MSLSNFRSLLFALFLLCCRVSVLSASEPSNVERSKESGVFMFKSAYEHAPEWSAMKNLFAAADTLLLAINKREELDFFSYYFRLTAQSRSYSEALKAFTDAKLTLLNIAEDHDAIAAVINAATNIAYRQVTINEDKLMLKKSMPDQLKYVLLGGIGVNIVMLYVAVQTNHRNTKKASDNL